MRNDAHQTSHQSLVQDKLLELNITLSENERGISDEPHLARQVGGVHRIVKHNVIGPPR